MIDYSKIASAIQYYSDHGFKYIEVPWTTSREIIEVTTQPDKVVDSDFGCLVGSAEQSFLQLIWQKKIESGNFVACSPCWRRDTPDALHQQWFIKVELISIGNFKMDVNEMVELCVGFYSKYVMTKTEKTKDGIDITNYSGIELGSYGTRSHPLIPTSWTYGTGCAEPRLTIASKRKPF